MWLMPATAVPPSLLTHIALPVRDLDATLAFYAKYTTLANIHQRHDDETGLRTACLQTSATSRPRAPLAS